MDERTAEILETANWDELTPRLLYYADSLLRRYLWRGARVYVALDNRLLVNGWDANDFLQEAINRVLLGKRKLNEKLDLEQNLKGAIKSLIWSWKKHSDRQPLTEWEEENVEEETFDPISAAVDEKTKGELPAVKNESIQLQKAIFTEFEESIAGDAELKGVFNAYKEEFYDPQDIETLTSIPAKRVSELKRKLKERYEKFLKRRTESRQ